MCFGEKGEKASAFSVSRANKVLVNIFEFFYFTQDLREFESNKIFGAFACVRWKSKVGMQITIPIYVLINYNLRRVQIPSFFTPPSCFYFLFF